MRPVPWLWVAAFNLLNVITLCWVFGNLGEGLFYAACSVPLVSAMAIGLGVTFREWWRRKPE